jgi:TPR repeat protein
VCHDSGDSYAVIEPRVVAVGLVLGLAAPAAAGPQDDAFDAYTRGDYPTALKLLQPLVNQGDANAQFSLGLMYNLGRGVPQDDAQAATWYRKAADQGLADAQDNLGFAYAKGRGIPQDYAQAIVWFRKAAEEGLADAQNNLGISYERGLGVPQDFVQSHLWFNLAASQGHAGGTKNRDIVAARMTPQQIAQAQKLASEWVAAHPRKLP